VHDEAGASSRGKNEADIIVFEYLGKMKLPKNSFGAKRLRGKLQFW